MEPTPSAQPTSPDLEDTLDFINTLEHSRDGDTEHLPSSETAGAWFAAHVTVGTSQVGAVRPADMETLRAARAALREIADALVAERPPAADAVGLVNGLLSTPDVPRLVPGSSGLTVTLDHVADPLTDALAHLAAPLVDLVARGEVDRLRTCDNGDCRWVFYDRSRTGRRRWCDMATCGNRAKAARHRARQRGPADPTT
jgi:predicted RNA-binding Zn ribbon-like protein